MPYVATRRALLSRPAAAGSTWTPLDLASLVAWWDFSDADTLFTDAGSTKVTTDGDAVYQANDKSVNGYHLTQSTADSRPLYNTGIQNGLSVLRLDGTDDYIDRATTPALSQPNTIVIAFNSDYTEVNDTIFDSQNAINKNRLLRHSGGVNYVTYSGAFGPQKAWGNTSEIVVNIFNGASSEMYVNGGIPETGNPGTGTGTGWRLGASGGAPSAYTQMDVFDIVICNAALSSSDLNALGAYLATKWDLSWTDVS